jgi:hypothetical protein
MAPLWHHGTIAPMPPPPKINKCWKNAQK